MSTLLSLMGWSFLPNLVTGWVQTIFYGIVIRAGDPKPRPGTPRYAEHRRRIHILVVALYLAYTIYEADFELRRAGSFYSDLGVPLNATERDIKSRFRRLAATYHPDKVGASSTGAHEDQAHAFFVQLKAASEVLTDPARRFAYERFGPDIAGWQHCTTVRDYVFRGLMQLIPFYGVTAASMYGLGLLGYLDWGRYERWVLMALLLLFEFRAVTRPGQPEVLRLVVNPLVALFSGGTRPPYLPFQAISLARKLALTLYIALSQIGPMLMADTASGQIVARRRTGNQEAQLRENLDTLEAMAKGVWADSTRLLETEMAPYANDEQALTNMRGKVKEWLIQNTIRADPMVKDSLGRSLQKRRVDAPAGAKGTR